MPKNSIKKVVLGGIFAALAVLINLFFAYLIPSSTTGLPIYSIPLVISSLYLGPWYSLIVGVVADFGIGFLGPDGYKPLFVLSKLAWTFIPGIIARKNYHFYKMLIGVTLAYIFASAGTTLALIVHFDSETALGSLIYRIPTLIGMTPPLVYLNHVIYTRIIEYQKPII